MDAAVPAHASLLTQFQDPAQADQLTRIMNELEETKVVLHDTIEAALERGQKIDTLIEKSNDLTGQRGRRAGFVSGSRAWRSASGVPHGVCVCQKDRRWWFWYLGP